MFDYSVRANLKVVKVDVNDDGPAIVRVCRMTVEMELDGGIARAIGGDFGVEALQALKDLTSTKVEFPIERIRAQASLIGIQETFPVAIEKVTGIKAVALAKKPKDDEEADPPVVRLEFSFPYADDVWIFLGRNMGAWVTLTLTKAQQELDFGPKTTAGPGTVGALSSATTSELLKFVPRVVGSDADDVDRDERDVHQVAETPEEAEEMRERRIAHEQEQLEQRERERTNEEDSEAKSAAAGDKEEMPF